MDCVCCGEELDNRAPLTPAWADGDNDCAYVTCPHCGAENFVFGLDDD